MAIADVLRRLGQMIGLLEGDEELYGNDPLEDEYEQEEDWQDEDPAPPRPINNRSRPVKPQPRPNAGADQNRRTVVRDNVVPIHPRENQYAVPAPSRHSAIIMYVRRKEDGQQIISYVLEGRSVILNCEEIDDAQCQRVIDILSGAAFALGGRIQRVSHRNYLFVPASVDIVNGEASAAERYQA